MVSIGQSRSSGWKQGRQPRCQYRDNGYVSIGQSRSSGWKHNGYAQFGSQRRVSIGQSRSSGWKRPLDGRNSRVVPSTRYQSGNPVRRDGNTKVPTKSTSQSLFLYQSGNPVRRDGNLGSPVGARVQTGQVTIGQSRSSGWKHQRIAKRGKHPLAGINRAIPFVGMETLCGVYLMMFPISSYQSGNPVRRDGNAEAEVEDLNEFQRSINRAIPFVGMETSNDQNDSNDQDEYQSGNPVRRDGN